MAQLNAQDILKAARIEILGDAAQKCVITPSGSSHCVAWLALFHASKHLEGDITFESMHRVNGRPSLFLQYPSLTKTHNLVVAK